jgi:putative addiction module killer protein
MEIFIKIVFASEARQSSLMGGLSKYSKNTVLYPIVDNLRKLFYFNVMIEVRQTADFHNWLRNLQDKRAYPAILARITRFEAGNFGDVKALGTGLHEARIHFGPGYRLYFMRQGRAIVLLLCGGNKSTQKRDIVRARTMMEGV